VRSRQEEEADVVMCNPPPSVLDMQCWMMDVSFKDKDVNPLAMMEVGEREEKEDPPIVHDEI
jgi:hypothetical protein